MPDDEPIAVALVGARPADEAGAPPLLPPDAPCHLVAYSDEGLAEQVRGEGPLSYYADYNMLLRDPAVELVLVAGPVELRRDFAVRALSAGHHVVLQHPFGETALDGERIMKTALRAGLVATMDLPWRADADLRALRHALSQENVGQVVGAQLFWSPEPDAAGGDPEAPDVETAALPLLDQLNVVIGRDVRDVTACAAGTGFLLYLSLRGGGWAIAQADSTPVEVLPRWLVHTPGALFTASEGSAAARAGGAVRPYRSAGDAEPFWQRVHAAVRSGAELDCHPVQIVRAMKLHEAALESLESGEPVTI